MQNTKFVAPEFFRHRLIGKEWSHENQSISTRLIDRLYSFENCAIIKIAQEHYKKNFILSGRTNLGVFTTVSFLYML